MRSAFCGRQRDAIMSFDIAIWRSNERLTDKAAQAIYLQLNDDDVSSVTADPSLLSFYDDLDAMFPLCGELPDESLDESPWSWNCEPSQTHYLLGLRGPKANEALTAVTRLARKHGLVLFDPQSGRIETQLPIKLLESARHFFNRLRRLFR
jgi:hypothetical protein